MPFNLLYPVKRINDVVRALSIQGKMNNLGLRTREDLQNYQQQQLSSLVAYAARHSSFYRNLYGDINAHKVALSDLPVTNKKSMMENYDRFVTDPRLKLSELQAHIGQLTSDEYYLEEYRVTTTSGSSGLKGVFVSNRKEWSTALAAFLRCGKFMGLTPRLPNRRKVCTIGADNPIHVSYRMAISSDIGLMKSLRLDATLGIEKHVTALNKFQPEYLSTYPSIASILAREQIEGRLNINPQVISTFGEVCTKDMEGNIKEAWGILPFNIYGMTEAGIILGSDCSCHRGVHVFEDLFIVEVVDEHNKPVPDGSPGSRLLITNLFNYSQPIIRYEVSDMLTISTDECPCGLPFRLISSIDGRSDDIIHLDSQQGHKVPVHPVCFYTAMGTVKEVKQYQVVHGVDGLHISLVLQDKAVGAEVSEKVKAHLKSTLEALGAQCPVMDVQLLEQFERDPRRMGKFKLVVSSANIPPHF